jgi:hypothetical protein
MVIVGSMESGDFSQFGSGDQAAGGVAKTVEDSVPLFAGLFLITGFQRLADPPGAAVVFAEGEVTPPDTVVIPDVVVVVTGSEANDETE